MPSDPSTLWVRRRVALAALTLVVSVVGCGGDSSDELPRVEVSGEVTKDGSPVKKGRVSFVPEGETKGPASGTGIVNGKFMIPRTNGPIPGTYLVRVEVTAESTEAKPDSPQQQMPTKDEILAGREAPAKDPRAGLEPTTLETADSASVEFHVTVEGDGPNKFALPIGGEATRSE